MNFKNVRTLSFLEWFICAFGMFFIGLGMDYIDVQIFNYGIFFFILGLILEIPLSI
jgi:hypothetical protein